MTKVEFFVDDTLKANVETLFSKLGLSMSEAITLLLAECEQRQGLPFEADIPNEETRRAIENVRAGINVTRYEGVEDWLEKMGLQNAEL